MKRLSPEIAHDLCRRYGVDVSREFHALRENEVQAVIAAADEWRYKKPRGANGSRARYFHAHLRRTCNRRED